MGQPKPWLPIAGQPMLLRIVHTLQQVVQPILVVGAPDWPLPPLPDGVALLHDPVPDQGPLRGLATGLSALHGTAHAAFVTSCDVPLLHSGFIQRMIDLLGEHDACVPMAAGYRHPLAAVYRVQLALLAQALLADGVHRPMTLLDRVRTRLVESAAWIDVDPNSDSLRNINTPDDYQALTMHEIPAVIHHLFISDDHNYVGHFGREPGNHPMRELPSIECVAGRGIRGDRYFNHKDDFKGQITFFSLEVYQRLCDQLSIHDRPPSAFRRNVIVEGVDLNALIDQEFTIQGVRFAGVEECRPCFWMEQAFGLGAEAALRGHGGLRARILSSGSLRSTAKVM